MFNFKKPQQNILTLKINSMLGLLIICFVGVIAALVILVKMNQTIQNLKELNEGAASQNNVINRQL